MSAYDWSKVSRVALEELASEAFVEEQRGGNLPPLRRAIAEAARQAAVPPPRTRAEVDREIGAIVRDYVRDVGAEKAFGSMSRDRHKLLALVAERTAPEPVAAQTATEILDGEFPEATEACSCEESERLKARIAELEDKGYRATALLIEAQQHASTAEARVRELEMALENAQASARGRGERVLAAESEARALLEKTNRALRILGPESGTFVSPDACVRAAIGALRG